MEGKDGGEGGRGVVAAESADQMNPCSICFEVEESKSQPHSPQIKSRAANQGPCAVVGRFAPAALLTVDSLHAAQGQRDQAALGSCPS